MLFGVQEIFLLFHRNGPLGQFDKAVRSLNTPMQGRWTGGQRGLSIQSLM